MMQIIDDRTLTEFAAKAAGIVGEWSEYDRAVLYPSPSQPAMKSRFDPLCNDGDALRLVVKIGLVMWAMPSGVKVADVEEEHDGNFENAMKAARKAITRAAAQIGKIDRNA